MIELTSQQATELAHRLIPAIQRLGIVVRSISPGAVELRLPIEGNTNHVGTMYAGALFAVAELPGGLLPMVILGPDSFTPIVTRVEVDFVAAARSGVTVSARMDPEDVRRLADQATSQGSASFTLDLVGVDSDGRTVIRSRGHYQLRPVR